MLVLLWRIGFQRRTRNQSASFCRRTEVKATANVLLPWRGVPVTVMRTCFASRLHQYLHACFFSYFRCPESGTPRVKPGLSFACCNLRRVYTVPVRLCLGHPSYKIDIKTQVLFVSQYACLPVSCTNKVQSLSLLSSLGRRDVKHTFSVCPPQYSTRPRRSCWLGLLVAIVQPA